MLRTKSETSLKGSIHSGGGTEFPVKTHPKFGLGIDAAHRFGGFGADPPCLYGFRGCRKLRVGWRKVAEKGLNRRVLLIRGFGLLGTGASTR